MQAAAKLLFALGYLLLAGPPRAIDLRTQETRSQGELSGQPLIVVLGVEFLVRGALLLVIFVSIESLLGDKLYESLRFDRLGMLLLGIGALHTLGYYVFLGLLQPKLGWTGTRLYRLIRNLCYAPLPGVLTIIPVLAWQWLQELDLYSGEWVEQVYIATTAVMLVAALVEAALIKRRPLGLDQALDLKRSG